MENGAVLHVCFVLTLLSEGLTAVIQTQQTVVAAVGGEACFSCQLMQHKEVLQVTWQKVLPEGEKNLATYSKYFGQMVNSGFQGKLEIKNVGMQNCSIIIREVTEQDEGCYRCLFNTYPDGALTGRTCLMLYELHEPILHVRESNSTQESLVSCSATGRPAPTLTLNVTQPHLHFSRYNTVSVHNSNGTVTVTTTAVLSGFRDNSAQVGCAVRVLSGHKEVFMMIPEVKQTSADDYTLSVVLACVGVAAVIIIIIIIIIISILLKHKCRNSLSQGDSEKNKTPQRTIKDAPESKTPLIKQENEHVRQRTGTSTKKRPNSVHLKPSDLTPKRLFY
ncbi:OX-2 membrane glycoprotein-like isoform X1 [Seriola lalandi dorsalis]|uniref:OX-2 membrane glycoprotein-like n=1 Tax=Seriola aureovittata TaxID=2871759 RepID=UPI000C6F47F7|nr:OX-2 membrane glycoprotein-like isoform X1 [Seriola lalandi dorsalis]XP_056226582.1 OX-2 membrane glycoprotein-like [Seriola aureovittata]